MRQRKLTLFRDFMGASNKQITIYDPGPTMEVITNAH